ncbi:MAG: xanthine dehydrogenase family protein molybdopterin-binding subunit [Acidobacteria bacterium]|nr:xanthine dehydrogenase family protein molybdopterin-binding subunit [Acidobacteriota bacterium]
MPNYSWPPMEQRRVMGKRLARLDGAAKASGKAKYNSDVRPAGTIHGAILHCPHAHCRVRSIDTSAAKALSGVTSVRVAAEPGKEIMWPNAEIAFVAARTEEIAREALRLIKVDYEVLPHLVREENLAAAGSRAKPAGEVVTGDPDAALRSADVVHEGEYGIPVITHCCLEPHGSTVQWSGNKVEFWPSTQAISNVGGDLAKGIELAAGNVHAHMDYVGGGFGSKFQADLWGIQAAHMSKESGGKPVKLYLDRAAELTIAGIRPSVYGKIRLGAKRDGTLVAWDSLTWMTGGMAGGGLNADLLPYVFRNVPNRRVNHTAVATNTGAQRAWRAPNHPQVSFVTCAALDDLAAKLNMDPLDFFKKNANLTVREAVYVSQLDKAADMIEWKKRYHSRGDKTAGSMKRGLGLAVGTWQGGGHASQCRTNIHPDGSVEVELGSQDIGTGTRTIITQVAAESLGLPMNAIKLNIGDNGLPPSGASGGSTTVGGVASSSRIATLNALEKLFEAVAPSLGAPADQLEAVDGKIQVKGNPAKSLTWKAACAKLGVKTISENGANDQRNPRGLNAAGVGGVHMADVSVDVETGVVTVNKVVAVQDCGLIINPKLAEGQVFGGVIMGICAALMEERVMDEATGRCLNQDMEFYKLAGIGDIGDIQVHMDITPDHDKRGVVGLGEPATIPTIAAIANACTNAIGVRVPTLPLTPRNVLNALAGRRMA